MTPDLFSYQPSYPAAPGFKERDTSAAAAVKIKPTAQTLRGQCLVMMNNTGHGMTADEVASALNVSILAIRPRFSELSQRGLIQDSGNRRANDSGRNAIVWKLTRNCK